MKFKLLLIFLFTIIAVNSYSADASEAKPKKMTVKVFKVNDEEYVKKKDFDILYGRYRELKSAVDYGDIDIDMPVVTLIVDKDARTFIRVEDKPIVLKIGPVVRNITKKDIDVKLDSTAYFEKPSPFKFGMLVGFDMGYFSSTSMIHMNTGLFVSVFDIVDLTLKYNMGINDFTFNHGVSLGLSFKYDLLGN